MHAELSQETVQVVVDTLKVKVFKITPAPNSFHLSFTESRNCCYSGGSKLIGAGVCHNDSIALYGLDPTSTEFSAMKKFLKREGINRAPVIVLLQDYLVMPPEAMSDNMVDRPSGYADRVSTRLDLKLRFESFRGSMSGLDNLLRSAMFFNRGMINMSFDKFWTLIDRRSQIYVASGKALVDPILRFAVCTEIVKEALEKNTFKIIYKLENQLQHLEVQKNYLKLETRNLEKELLHAQEEAVPLVIGQFLEAVDQDHAIVGSTTGSNYYVCVLSTLDRELLKTSCSVALHKYSYALVDVLPPEADSSIQMLRAEEKPDVSYSDIGGLDMQKQEVRKAVELLRCSLE